MLELFKKPRLQKIVLKNYCCLRENNELGAHGKNNILFVGFLLLTYGLILTMAWYFYLLILFLAIPVFYYTRNPFRFHYYKYLICWWKKGDSHMYRWHKRFSIFGIDVYILNGYTFAPGRKMQTDMKIIFDQLDKRLNEICA